MASWSQVEAEAPELAALARGFLEAGKHKTLATLRRDGSPRISGTEAEFADGELWFGSMWQATKALDLQRDPRFALHSASEGSSWKGDAKLAGNAVEITDEAAKEARSPGRPTEWHLFHADISELVVVRLGEPSDHLVIESWHEGRGVTSVRRQ